MSEYLNIGPCPSEEECVPIAAGSDAMKRECRRYIDLIILCLGNPPEGARLAVHREPYEYDAYYEVVCFYDPAQPESLDYAFKCESQGPTKWSDSPVAGILANLTV